MTPISKELSEQIEREARLYAKSHGHKEIGFSSLAYEAGATAYAHYKERFEQAKKAIEAFKITFNDKSKSAIDLYKEMDNLFEALASWKDEGKQPSLRQLSSMTIEEWQQNKDKFSPEVYYAIERGYIEWSDKPRHVLVLENRLRTNTLLFNDGMVLMEMGFDLRIKPEDTNKTE